MAPQNSASNLKLIDLALSGKSVDFTKVISMIEEMVVLLKAEQGVDDSKKAYCLGNFDKTEDAKELAKTIVGHEDVTQEFQEQLSNTDDRVAVMQKSIAEIDDSVAKATEIRRKQHAEFVTLTANNAAATELFTLAAKRTEQILRAPSCTRRRRRLSSVQTTACTSTWVARSPELHPRASQARMSHGCSCCRPLPRPSEANLTARLRARRKRQGTRTERMPQSIATVLINSRCSPSTSTQKVSRSCLEDVAQSPHRDEHHRHCLVCSITCDFGRAVRSHPVCHPRNALHDMCFSTFRLPFSASVTWKRCTCCTTVASQPRSDAFDATGSMFSRRDSASNDTCGELEICRALLIILSFFDHI